MKAITVYQPYATLAVHRGKAGIPAKTYETRSWATSYRGPLAIHAAKRHPAIVLDTLPAYIAQAIRMELREMLLEDLPTGCIVGGGNLVACHYIDEAFLEQLHPEQRIYGDYSLGRYAWELDKMQELTYPIPIPGKQGLWNWEGSFQKAR